MKSQILENGNLEITIEYVIRSTRNGKKIIPPDAKLDDKEPLVVQLARGFRWQKYIDEGYYKNTGELARAIGISESYVAKVTRLTTLAPSMIHQVLTGNIPPNMSISQLRNAIPVFWDEQEQLYMQKKK